MAQGEENPIAEHPSVGMPERLRVLWSNPQIRYPILVLLYLLLIGSIVNAMLEDLRRPLERLEELTAASVHYFIRIFTELTTHRGNLVTFDGFAVSIIVTKERA